MPPHLGHLVWPRARESVPLKCFSLGLGSVLCQDSCWDLPRPAALALEVLSIYKALCVPVKSPAPAPLALRFHWLVSALGCVCVRDCSGQAPVQRHQVSVLGVFTLFGDRASSLALLMLYVLSFGFFVTSCFENLSFVHSYQGSPL